MSKMSEIKFRGMSVDVSISPWKYGYLFVTRKSNTLKEETYWIFNDDGKFKVIPETVGQFIRLKDLNATDIYEGDIAAMFDFENPSFRDEVIFHDGGFGYIVKDGSERFISFAENHAFKWNNGQSNEIKVIGNVYQNPELLEVG